MPCCGTAPNGGDERQGEDSCSHIGTRTKCGSGLAPGGVPTKRPLHPTQTPETTKATRRWPLFGEASAKHEAYLTAQPVSSARALPMSASERTVLTPAS